MSEWGASEEPCCHTVEPVEIFVEHRKAPCDTGHNSEHDQRWDTERDGPDKDRYRCFQDGSRRY